MNATGPIAPNRDDELNLLLPEVRGSRLRHWGWVGGLSVLFHIVLLGGLESVPNAYWNATPPPSDLTTRRVTPLVAPRFNITQKAPNVAPVSKQLDLQSLVAKPTPHSSPSPSAPAAKPVSVGLPKPPAPPPAPTPAPTPTPQVAAVKSLPPPPGIQTSTAPPAPVPAPQIQVQEPPKLAFELPEAAPSQTPGRGQGIHRLTPPHSTLEEALRTASRSGPTGVAVGDSTEPVPSGIGQTGSVASRKPASGLELMSDPMGVDFKPYLIRVLAAVRRNWLAVIPESTKFGGRRGRVLIQFSINRQGQVPKLVIASTSGADPLDRAAVAGVSASTPFPPLPQEFSGQEIRLQLSFLYNQ